MVQIQGDLNAILEVTLVRTAEMFTPSIISYNLARDCFSVEKKRGNTTKPEMQINRRGREIHYLRKEMKTLNRMFKASEADEKEGIRELTSTLQEWLITISRTEGIRKRLNKVWV